MPSPIKGVKHAKFKLRANKDFPEREFKVEFTSVSVSISKKGDRNAHHIRWRPLIGQMLLFGSDPIVFTKTGWRGFLVEFKSPRKGVDTTVEIEFGDKGVKIKPCWSMAWTFWSWHTILNVAITGI